MGRIKSLTPMTVPSSSKSTFNSMFCRHILGLSRAGRVDVTFTSLLQPEKECKKYVNCFLKWELVWDFFFLFFSNCCSTKDDKQIEYHDQPLFIFPVYSIFPALRKESLEDFSWTLLMCSWLIKEALLWQLSKKRF